MTHYFSKYSRMMAEAMASVDLDQVVEAEAIISTSINVRRPILVFGNGGSASVAEHFAADLTKATWKDCDFYPHVVSLTGSSSLMTAIANDVSYDEVFAMQVARWPRSDAVRIAISSSGSSPNVVKALNVPGNSYATIALVGFDGGRVLKEKLADAIIHVKSDNYGVVEDCHSMILHSINQSIRIAATSGRKLVL